jgi:hypothetical protein
MALAETTLSSTAAVTPTAFAAPTTAETITNPGRGVFLWVKIGGTATTVTLVRPGTHGVGGDAIVDWTVVSGATNTERVIPVPASFADTDGDADVTFSQVTGVTALLVRS